MTDEDALLKAICAEPDEDTPRLVFADWLDEQGGDVNSTWATFIRGQVRLAREPDADGGKLARRVGVVQNEFLKGKWIDRLGVAADGLVWAVWERGFPELLSGRVPAVRVAWPRISDRVPVRALMLGGVDTVAAEDLAGWSGLWRLARLLLHGDQTPTGRTIGDRGLSALAGCKGLAGLVVLEARFVAATDTGVTALLDSPHLTGLETLFLAFGDRGSALSPQVVGRIVARFGSNCRP
jgi:uncharacterized protein (TIGR02996 family)